MNKNWIYFILFLLAIWIEIGWILFFLGQEQYSIDMIIKICIIFCATFCIGIYLSMQYFNGKIQIKWLSTLYILIAAILIIISFIFSSPFADWFKLGATLIAPNYLIAFLLIASIKGKLTKAS